MIIIDMMTNHYKGENRRARPTLQLFFMDHPNFLLRRPPAIFLEEEKRTVMHKQVLLTIYKLAYFGGYLTLARSSPGI